MKHDLIFTTEPALPPRWTLGLAPPTPSPAKPAAQAAVKTPPDAPAGAGDDETAASGGQADGKAAAAEAALRHAAGWDSPAWRELAAFNRIGVR